MIPWYLLALLAAILWGFEYAMTEQVLKRIPTTAFVFISTLGTATPLVIFACLNSRLTSEEFKTLTHPSTLGMLTACVLSAAAAELLVLYAIKDGTATGASMIEMSYPFFVAIAAFALFREQSFNLPTLGGGLLIGLGTYFVIQGQT